MPKLNDPSRIIIVRTVTAIRSATIAPLEVVLFRKDTISLRGNVKIVFF